MNNKRDDNKKSGNVRLILAVAFFVLLIASIVLLVIGSC